MLDFVQSFFFCSNWKDSLISLSLFMWWIIFLDLNMLNRPYVAGMKPTLLSCIASPCDLNSACKFLLRYFVYVFINDIIILHFIYVVLCIVLVPEQHWLLKKLGSIPSFATLWNNFNNIGVDSSLKVLWNSTMNPCGPGKLI